MADVAEPWGSAESDGASVRDLFDPVSLEARLVEARARRARVLATRSGGYGPVAVWVFCASLQSFPINPAEASALLLRPGRWRHFGLGCGLPGQAAGARPIVHVAPPSPMTLPVVSTAPAGVPTPEGLPRQPDASSLLARAGVPRLVPPQPTDVLLPEMASLVFSPGALGSRTHSKFSSGGPIAASRSRSITSPAPLGHLGATNSLVRIPPFVLDLSDGDSVPRVWRYSSVPGASSAGSPSDFRPLFPPIAKPSGDPGILPPGTPEPPTTPLPPPTAKPSTPQVPTSGTRPQDPRTPPPSTPKPPTTRPPSAAQPTPTAGTPEPPSKPSHTARGQGGSKPQPAAGTSKARGNAIDRDRGQRGISEPNRSGRSAGRGHAGLSGHSHDPRNGLSSGRGNSGKSSRGASDRGGHGNGHSGRGGGPGNSGKGNSGKGGSGKGNGGKSR